MSNTIPVGGTVRVWVAARDMEDCVDVFVVVYRRTDQWYFAEGEWFEYQDFETIRPVLSIPMCRVVKASRDDLQDAVRDSVHAVMAEVLPTIVVDLR